jgi:hypothetical protein
LLREELAGPGSVFVEFRGACLLLGMH